MGQSLAIPRVIPNDWKRLDLIVNKIKMRLGSSGTPTFVGVTISGLTASTLVGADTDKALESITVGTGLDYTRPNLTLSHLGIEDLTDAGADKILFWDDTASACKWLGVGNSIVITDVTIDTIQDIRTSASPTFVGLTLSAIAAEATDVDKFLVDSTGVIKYRTGAQVLSDIGGQASDAGLTSLAGLVYASDSFIKVTATDTYAIRTITETKTDLSLNLVENAALSTWAGTTNVITLGTITTGTWTGTTIAILNGGTGQTTAQLAINALSAVGAATNEHVLTKDTGTGNAIWKASGGGAFSSRVYASLSASQTITTGTWTKVLFNSEIFDGDGEYDNVTNFRFTATSAGYYWVGVTLRYYPAVANKYIQAAVKKNGTDYILSSQTQTTTTDALNTICFGLIYLAATDFIEVETFHIFGVNGTLLGAATRPTYFCVHRLS